MGMTSTPLRASELWRTYEGGKEFSVFEVIQDHGLAIDDLISAANIGITLRDRGETEPAGRIFRSLIDAHPHSSIGWYELAILLSETGDAFAAIPLLEQALSLEPTALRFRLTYARQLAKVGATKQAFDVLNRTQARNRPEQDQLLLNAQFVRYLAAYPEARARHMVNSLVLGPSHLTHEQVEQAIGSAIAQGRPFSVIRLGDGEGAWVHLDTRDEAAFSKLYEANRREFLRIWFGDEAAYTCDNFFNLAGELGAVMDRTDVVGVPYPSRVDHEYRITSARGIPSCVNVLRLASRKQAQRRSAAYCSHDIHLDLQITGAFRRLLSGGLRLGLISCHGQLAEFLSAQTGANVVRSFLIPGEKGFSDILGEGVHGVHYPTAFDAISEQIAASDLRNQVWLVAAGYLGKFYCDRIKSSGGVALDIGSLADGWLGKITRPTLTTDGRFAL